MTLNLSNRILVWRDSSDGYTSTGRDHVTYSIFRVSERKSRGIRLTITHEPRAYENRMLFDSYLEAAQIAEQIELSRRVAYRLEQRRKN